MTVKDLTNYVLLQQFGYVDPQTKSVILVDNQTEFTELALKMGGRLPRKRKYITHHDLVSRQAVSWVGSPNLYKSKKFINSYSKLPKLEHMTIPRFIASMMQQGHGSISCVEDTLLLIYTTSNDEHHYLQLENLHSEQFLHLSRLWPETFIITQNIDESNVVVFDEETKTVTWLVPRFTNPTWLPSLA